MYLDELSDFVARVWASLGIEFSVSVSSVSRILAENGITRNMTETWFTSRNELAGARWVHSQWDTPLRTRVYVDEAHRCFSPNESRPGSCEGSGPSAKSRRTRE